MNSRFKTELAKLEERTSEATKLAQTCQEDVFKYMTIMATKKQVRELTQRIDTFSNIDHIHKIKTHFFPLFENFGNKINEFYDRMDEMEVCIRSFDYDMNIKVNKS